MKQRYLVLLILFLGLAAFGALNFVSNVLPQGILVAAQSTKAFESAPEDDLSRTDEQGAVAVTVKALNLHDVRTTLDFEVVMNTHSVDLGMNLATLTTLTTDTGLVVQATAWDAPGGGHHVSGTLSFPARVNNTLLLDKATSLTLTLRNVDVPERVFKWEISK